MVDNNFNNDIINLVFSLWVTHKYIDETDNLIIKIRARKWNKVAPRVIIRPYI